MEPLPFTQTSTICAQVGRSRSRRLKAEKPNHRHHRLLRACRERPRHQAAEQRYELATPHSITSSARASSIGEISRPSVLAVLTLMINSSLVGNSMGKSATEVPLSMLCT